jgi:hypothetical protein
MCAGNAHSKGWDIPLTAAKYNCRLDHVSRLMRSLPSLALAGMNNKMQ